MKRTDEGGEKIRAAWAIYLAWLVVARARILNPEHTYGCFCRISVWRLRQACVVGSANYMHRRHLPPQTLVKFDTRKSAVLSAVGACARFATQNVQSPASLPVVVDIQLQVANPSIQL